MANDGAGGKVTIDKSYFDTLLRRANFQTLSQLLGRSDSANISITKVEYDNLLRSVHEYNLLKSSLLQGGLAPEALQLLIAGGPNKHPHPNPVEVSPNDTCGSPPAYISPVSASPRENLNRKCSWKLNNNDNRIAPHSANSTPCTSETRISRRDPYISRQVSQEEVSPSILDPQLFDDLDNFLDDVDSDADPVLPSRQGDLRTLYFVGFNGRTSCRDLLSVIKGGKLLSVNFIHEKSATVTFLDAAPHYLAWVKRNGLYLHGRRVEVRWADRQFNLNDHISKKVADGATRNILIHDAWKKGLTDARIREDMEHIQGLIIIDITFRNGHAYVSTNSVHNALFARTCMMSRSTYKGCKINFYPDECDVALPMRTHVLKRNQPQPSQTNMSCTNRFDMLQTDDVDINSD